MPIFEYKCGDCGTKFEVLHKKQNDDQPVNCPNCKSTQAKRLFSAFATSASSSEANFQSGCGDGSCGLPSAGGCASGMCPFN